MRIDDHGVPAYIAKGVWSAQQGMRHELRDSLCAAVEVGRWLCRAKEHCRHGEFGPWIGCHFEGTKRLAEAYMALFRRYPSTADVPAMSLREALRALSGRDAGAKRPMYAHERISPATLLILTEQVRDAAARIQTVMRSLSAEGCSPQHEAVRLARRMGAAISATRSYLAARAAADEAPITAAPAEEPGTMEAVGI
jgi:hypothetical protein